MPDLKTLKTRLSGATERIKSISANLGKADVASPQNEEEAPKEKVGLLDWARGILQWGGWSDLLDLYKKLVDAGIVKPSYEPPEKMTEADIRRIIAEAISAQEKPLWQKVLPWASTATLGAIAIILLVKKLRK